MALNYSVNNVLTNFLTVYSTHSIEVSLTLLNQDL